MKFIKIKARAKINLSLNIISKLPSKIHKIESLITFVKLHDIIYFRITNSTKHKVYFIGKFSKKISKKNTVNLLLEILDKKNLLNNQKFEIKIVKNIPQMSGMGGGSMNAASLLSFFLKKKILNLTKKKLINISNLIGSDVILGLKIKNKVLSANGNLTSINKKLFYNVLIVKPNFGCSTKLIFSKVKQFSRAKYNEPNLLLFKKDNIIASKNDLEKIAFKKYPKLKELKVFLSKLPDVEFSRMTGSGSAIVAYFHSKKALNIATIKIKKQFENYWYIKSETI
jgi:4-diphosphocytidyl-2-C-methyl-D-erythritol kinase